MKLGSYRINFTYEDDRYRSDMICEATQQRAACESARVTTEEAADARYDAKYYQQRDFADVVVKMLIDHALNKPTAERNT